VVVTCKFRQEQIVYPIVLQIGNISPKVFYDHCGNPLGLSVGLWVECGGKLWVNLMASAKVVPKAGCKLGSPIGYDCFR
jgi:hypothetical protein